MPRYHDAGVEWSLTELANAASIPLHSANSEREKDWASGFKQGGDWMNGLTSVDQASRLMQQGWAEGTRKLEKLARDVHVEGARTRKRRQEWRDQGDDLNVDRAMLGAWDQAWRSSRRVWSAGKQHVELVSMWGGHCGLTSEQMFWQGAAVTVAADLLDQAGYSVRIVAANGFQGEGWGHNTPSGVLSVVVKEYDEPIQIDAVASVMCHAGIFRLFGFRGIASLPFDVGIAYAYPAHSWDQNNYRTRMETAGEWSDETVLVGSAHSMAACIAEIERICKVVGT